MLRGKQAPKPKGWNGVQEGLHAAMDALRHNRLDQAQTILREVIEFAPLEAKAWHLLGKAVQEGGDHKLALDHFRRAQLLYKAQQPRPRKRLASITLARLLWMQGNRPEAKAMLATLMMRTPDDARLDELRREWATEEANG